MLTRSADFHLLDGVGPCLCNDRLINKTATAVRMRFSHKATHTTISQEGRLFNETMPRSAGRGIGVAEAMQARSKRTARPTKF